MLDDETDWIALRAKDLEAALRLSHELGEFRPGSEAQRRHFLAGLGAIVGAPVTMWLDLEVGPSGDLIIAGVDDHGWSSASDRASLRAYLVQQSEVEDPTVAPMHRAHRPGRVATCVRRQLVDDSSWYGSAHFQDYRRGAGLDDFIYSSLAVGTRLQSFSIHRPLCEQPFTERERALVGAIHAACAPFLDDTDMRRVLGLSPRLRDALHGLLRGLTDKQIAAELGLSPHTLHGYVKTLYRRLGVSTRLELATRFGRLGAAEVGGPPSSRRR